MLKIKFWNGRLYVAVPPRLRQRRRVADALGALQSAAPACSPPPLRTSPRPRAPRRATAAAGRDGTGKRDDGSGSDGDGPPAPAGGVHVLACGRQP